ncbi:hypothetical protein ANCDUO_04608 [Ancylostoma duodenale]|uniref:Uncharacterized protein n=1 Tax=Ancylostoma duodenale TaxID=51022 RepID=A0A0C2DQT0_9BILA|nr:hypothetical protein ANCDUO_04608 [Ancylostoma duodenale]
MQARKIRYDVTGLSETSRHQPLNATFDTGEELFLETCHSRRVGVLVNTNLVMNIDSFQQLTIRIGRLRLRRCGSIAALTIFAAFAPTSSYNEERVEKWSPKPIISLNLFTLTAGFWEDAVVGNIDEEYGRFVQHFRDNGKEYEGLRATKKRLSYEIPQLILQGEAARAAGSYQLTSELAKRCKMKKTKNTRLRAHLFNTTVLPAFTYALETQALRKQDENAVNVVERSIERMVLGITRFTQLRAGIRSCTLRQQSEIRNAAAYPKSSMIRWAVHVVHLGDNRCTRSVSDWTPRNFKRTTGPPTRWSDFLTKSFNGRYNALGVP